MLAEEALLATAPDHRTLDLDGAERITYLLQQSFRYDYPRPVRRVQHRLVVVPPRRHGNQHLRAHRVEVAGAVARRRTRRDTRGNTVVRWQADRVEQNLTFEIAAVLERVRPGTSVQLAADALTSPALLRPTWLTAADDRLRALAAGLRVRGVDALGQAERICTAVHESIRYEYGSTSVRTTAAQAWALGRGVCQDSAHIMLALCRELGLPARYVSGHLLGQGGTHAWVEVVVADGAAAAAVPFDPCNGVAAGVRHLTVAVGRDYADVRPTSGSYLGPAGGRLTTDRRVAVLSAA